MTFPEIIFIGVLLILLSFFLRPLQKALEKRFQKIFRKKNNLPHQLIDVTPKEKKAKPHEQ